MSFLFAILFFLFVAVVMIVMRVVVAAIRFKRRVKNTMDGMFNRGESARERTERQDSGKKHSKVYPKNVGEYVAFEEIAVDESAPSDNASSQQRQSYVEESQISDVEFEEIKES